MGEPIHRIACAAVIAALVGLGVLGCGSASTKKASTTLGAVSVNVTSPTSGSVIAADKVTIRGTVSPTNAVVQIQGKPAAVGNGVFTGTASLHGGKTTIDIIGSAAGATPGSTNLTITRQTGRPVTRTTTRTVVIPQTEQAQPSGEGERTFFVPSGNVTCALQGDGARCSVASANLTFVLPPGGGAAYRENGQAIARSTGAEAPFGSEQSNGSVACTIPPSNIPAGISCRDGASGHGFEASRVPARQKLY
jgi:hypothetical protein